MPVVVRIYCQKRKVRNESKSIELTRFAINFDVGNTRKTSYMHLYSRRSNRNHEKKKDEHTGRENRTTERTKEIVRIEQLKLI